MAYVKVPKDLTKIKTKVVFNLTKRQLFCFSLGGIVGGILYFATKPYFGSQGSMLLLVVTMIPFFVLSMYEKDGLPAEKYWKYILRQKIFYPPIRYNKQQNLYGDLIKEGNKNAKPKSTKPNP